MARLPGSDPQSKRIQEQLISLVHCLQICEFYPEGIIK
jgi:hypothetical protein